MFGRTAVIGLTVVALGAPAVQAQPVFTGLLGLCFGLPQSQCAIQIADGDRNRAKTKQFMVYSGDNSEWQFSFTYQNGDDNNAHTTQKSTTGADQLAVTTQVGNNNHAGIYQKGDDQVSIIAQEGNGHYGAISAIGSGGQTPDVTAVVQSN
jgi:hypothetical protein